MRIRTIGIGCACGMLIAFFSTTQRAFSAEATRKIDYANNIRPIFQASCAKCHLNGTRKGGIDLGSRDNLLKGGESEEPAVVPHDPSASRLMKLVTSDDPDMVMPQKGKRLSEDQIATLRTWIERGAPWGDAPGAEPKYVARVEPRHPALPEGSASANPIDRWLKTTSGDVVDDRLFARRAYLDVMGLLPTSKQTDTFRSDQSPDKREKLV